ncbi:MAG: NADH-quinone oxidoreductase subunit A [Nitrospirae bacterium]|nr:NADH-quinone oxidoreductase subunit A [Nitrospirota bacterium]MBI3594355.1 NADH-quinone oxidoreductase subunit A [Nitrospirota bacterium]
MAPETFLPENYLPILIFIFVAIAFGGGSLLVGTLVRPRYPYKEKLLPYESGSIPFSDARRSFPFRYYVIAMLFVVFDVEAIFFFPWAVVFQKVGFYALIEMIVFMFILMVGYFYAWKKGALEWD